MSSRSLLFESVEPRLLMAVDLLAELTPGPNPIAFSSLITSTQIQGDGEVYFVAASSLYRYDESERIAERLTILDDLADRGTVEVHEMIYALGRPWFFVEESASSRKPETYSLITLDDFGDPVEVWFANTLDDRANIRVPFTLVEESNDELFFHVRTGATPPLSQLWSTQGTVATTNLVTEFAGSLGNSSPVVSDGRAFYTGSYTVNEFIGDGWVSEHVSTLLVSDPNLTRPVEIHESGRYYDRLFEFESDVYASSADGLVRNDGTVEGTELLTDYLVRELTESGGLLYFVGYDDNGPHLGRTDGTIDGTIQLAACEAQIVPVDGRTFALCSSDDVSTLYETDGTPEGTVELRSGGGRSLTRVGEQVFFVAGDGRHGDELWVTDGTAEGTRIVRDINDVAEGADSTPLPKAGLGDRLIFTANDGVNGFGLWVTDGTEAGTQLLSLVQTDIPANRISAARQLGDFVVLDDSEAIFAGASEATGTELWRTDGTPEGTGVVFAATGMDGFSFGELTVVEGGVLFSVFDENSSGLWLYTPDEVDELFADINDDGEVGFADFLLLSENFGRKDFEDNAADLNDDGLVNFHDFLLLAQEIGQTL